MWEKIIEYFSKRHMLTNFLVIGVLVGGVFSWHSTPKEEYPDVSFPFLRISAKYSGASPEEVEHFLTRPIEDALKGIDGIHKITSTSGVGSCSVRVELEHNNPDRDEIIMEIKNTVLDVKLPDDVTDEPRFREFKPTKKAIIDIVLINTNFHLLTKKARKELQSYAFALENQLVSLSEINNINRSGYLEEEMQIYAHPEKLMQYNIPFNNVMREIRNNHVRQPAGSIESKQESKVTLISELDNIKDMKNLIIQGGFEGRVIRLKDIADVKFGYQKNISIRKVNGHESVTLNAVKTSSSGILKAMDAMRKTVNNFKKNNLKGKPIKIVLLDDESVDIRNRLSIIKLNGMIGFAMILIMLFLFLNFKSGIWVAIGIPFTFRFTMVAASMMGHTINNITLAAVIIVMGMVVDDAIVVAENITRFRSQGMDHDKAAIKGTSYVFMPIVASIITTCVAFLSLYFMTTGRHSVMIKFIPPIVFLMLGASLFESVIILPGHMNLKMPGFLKKLLFPGSSKKKSKIKKYEQRHWFHDIEDKYGRILEKALNRKGLVFIVFGSLIILSLIILFTTMKYEMFPREETRSISLEGKAPKGTTRFETAKLSQKIEKILSEYIGKEVIGFRTSIARSRHGRAVEQNRMSMRIEIVSKDNRKKSSRQLMKEWDKKFEKIKKSMELKYRKHHFGQSSGSPIEIIIQENNDKIRQKIADELVKQMKKHSALTNAEIDKPMENPEYRIDLRRDKVKRLGINPKNIGTTLRALLEGVVLFELKKGDEEIKVRFTADESSKDDINKVLNIPVENQGDYLVPLKDIVKITKDVAPNSIAREEFKRITKVFSDMKEDRDLTPVEVAEYFETKIFPELLSKYPASIISFGGEVKDTRESGSDFIRAMALVVILMYIVLALLFNSLYKPVFIMLSILFGGAGIILAFFAHGITTIGFFTIVGALGMAGVVVNDSIIMWVKLDKEYIFKNQKSQSDKQVADIAKTRLRAVVLTTLTTVAGLLPTAYGFAGYDYMLSGMMLALAWGLIIGTSITLLLIPCFYGLVMNIKYKFSFPANKI